MSTQLKLFILSFSLVTTIQANPEPQYPCKPPYHNSYSFCNTSLSYQTRAQSLISHLTITEKITQLCNNATPMLRLGIPSFEWWSESLHGIAANGPGVSFNGVIPSATLFPQVILTAASFNRTLWFNVAAAIAVEARAMYNVGQAGLTFWGPNINVFRDPRWGRGQETPGEDPVLVSAFGVEYVKGFQGEGDLMVSACCKHFTAYDLEQWGNFSRYSFNAMVSEQDLEETYQPPFKGCIEEGKSSCLMCSYNQVNGIPACAHQDLLQKARNEWGFEGYITSDCDAVATVYEYQGYVKSPEDAAAVVLKAGLDINCGTYLLLHTQSALDEGKIFEKDIDRALLNLFTVQMRLGLFNGDPLKGKFGKLGTKDVCTSEHRKLALEAVKQGVVLLKNEKRFLPLTKVDVASLAVIGPMANSTSNLGGSYSGIPCYPKSFFEGFQDHVETTTYIDGCIDVSCGSTENFSEAVHIAREADVVVVVAGLDLSQETEDRDRVSLLLPGKQMDLISAVALASKRPLVLILVGGGPIDISFAKQNPQIASILWVGYPGEAGGDALADIIFGKFNPGGRLPMTWYPESFTSVPMNDMSMRADPSRGYPGRTYRFYTGDQVYGFGHGLSYTNYTYNFISAPSKISLLGSPIKVHSAKNNLQMGRTDGLDYLHVDKVPSCDELKFSAQISVTNNGDMDGTHVVMLFSRLPRTLKDVPQRQLVGFARIHTESYRATETSILIEPCKHFSTVNRQGIRVLPLGDHTLVLEDLEHFISIETQ
ncbi:hypothetical protein GIB67_003273 [Kingdonia uniflora]|uniref:Fibronectin type III-like domain-containing protein n=1 Tax=Kingdonia uniflora TaxID=39325 RepID=A0A7J7LXP1_9MAGN|nr:hypothetical protein GIB67_003273 [Kingdonia uniflora]